MNLTAIRPLIPYVSVAVIAMGFVKHLVYYRYFNVQIKHFMSVSEILLLFADDFLFLLLVYIIPILIIALLIQDNVARWNLVEANELAQKPFKKRLLSFNYKMRIVTALTLAFTIYRNKSALIDIMLYTVLFLDLVPTILSELRYKYNKLSSTRFPNVYWNLIMLTLFSFAFMITNTLAEILSVEYGKYNGTTIVTNDKCFVSTKQSFFIGKTDKYVFVYNKQDSSSTILKVDDVQQIKMKIN